MTQLLIVRNKTKYQISRNCSAAPHLSYFFLSVEGLEAGVRPDVVVVEHVVGRAGDDGGVRTLDIGFITERNIPVN